MVEYSTVLKDTKTTKKSSFTFDFNLFHMFDYEVLKIHLRCEKFILVHPTDSQYKRLEVVSFVPDSDIEIENYEIEEMGKFPLKVLARTEKTNFLKDVLEKRKTILLLEPIDKKEFTLYRLIRENPPPEESEPELESNDIKNLDLKEEIEKLLQEKKHETKNQSMVKRWLQEKLEGHRITLWFLRLVGFF